MSILWASSMVPDQPFVAELTFATGVDITANGRPLAAKFDGDFWTITMSFNRREPSFIRGVQSRVAEAEGGFDSLQIPYWDYCFGTDLGSPTVSGASQSGTTVATAGWNAGAKIERGMMLSWETNSDEHHAYLVTRPVTADGSGNAVITIRPRIRPITVGGEPINYRGPAPGVNSTDWVYGVFIPVGTSISRNATRPTLSDLSVTLREWFG